MLRGGAGGPLPLFGADFFLLLLLGQYIVVGGVHVLPIFCTVPVKLWLWNLHGQGGTGGNKKRCVQDQTAVLYPET